MIYRWHRLLLLQCLNFLKFAGIGKRIEAARSVAEGNEGYRTAESLAAFYAVSPAFLKKITVVCLTNGFFCCKISLLTY